MSALDHSLKFKYGGDRGITSWFENERGVMVSKLDAFNLYQQTRAELEWATELLEKLAETQPLLGRVDSVQAWTGKRLVAVGDENGMIYDGAAFQDIAADVMPGSRLP